MGTHSRQPAPLAIRVPAPVSQRNDLGISRKFFANFFRYILFINGARRWDDYTRKKI